MPLVKQQNTWAQAAGKGLNSIDNGPSTSTNSEMGNDQDNSGNLSTKVNKMEENVTETTLAAAYSEGWGQRGVNQDTAWDVPSSPHLSPKEGSTWTNSTSSGTEIWENNVRHHVKSGNTKPPNQVREPWGHTPTTHIGGTWGEEEDTTNLWTGVPQASGATWGNESSTSVWGANPAVENKNWGSQNNLINPNMAPNWNNEPPALQIGLPHMPLTNDTKNIVEDNSPDNAPPWADPSHKASRGFCNWSPSAGGKKLTTGWEDTVPPPNAGQSGGNYDDGTAVWGNPVHQGKVSHWKEMPPNKQMPNCVMPPNNMCQGNNPCAPHTGPGMIRLPQAGSNINNTDKSWMKNPILNRNMSWNEMPSHRDPITGRRIFDISENQLPDKSVPGTPNTPNSAFGNWGEPTHPMGPYWSAKSKNSGCNWADGQVDTSSWGGPLKQSGKPLTKDLIWASKQFRILMEMNFKKDDVENALRRSNMNLEDALMELHALNNKDVQDIDISLSSLNLNQPRVHLGNISDDMSFTDHTLDNSLPPNNVYGNNFPGMNMFSTGFNSAQTCKTQNSVGNNITPILGNAGSNNQVPNLNLNNGINNLSPAMMRKLLEQTQTFNPACMPQNTGRMNQQNFSSSAQLRLLAQQIQVAVQAGHLNPTILNQPLSPQTLCFLFQLLQQIKVLHQLQQQQMYFSQHGSKPGSPPLQLSVQITQTKQHIMNLQNQIAAQQAIFLKQQVQLPVQHPSLQNPQPSSFDVVKSNLESINGLHSEFRDLSMKEPPSQSHSRLNQWKLPPFDKEDNPTSSENNRDNSVSGSEFSRAPGSITKSSSSNSLSSGNASHSSSNLQPLSENVWNEMTRSQNDTWSDPNDSNTVPGSSDSIGNCETISDGSGSNKHNSASDNKDSPATSTNPSTSSSSQSYNLNDLVPEFEPGKPWKGTSRIKNFEDDPHVTPGSIAKSPLSLNSIKDSELFTWNSKQNIPNLSSSSLTSSTWTFSPPPTQNSGNSALKTGNSRSWGNQPSDQDRGTWKGSTQMPKTSRPPPGLNGQKQFSSNWRNNDSLPQAWEKQGGSNFLVLKNLTPQIDGSTLKTLCLQHGPLQLFHLLLNHGIALVRYSTREETEKARSALNNCVLSNTTILVDIPTEMEVKQYLQLASGQVSSNVSWPSGSGNSESSFTSGTSYPTNSSSAASSSVASGKASSNNWNSTSLNLQSSNLWSFSGSGNSLWAMQSSATEHDQCIPSSLNSFLPGDLLGGSETI
ncbi:protein Gawky isoform X3 [Parasteatoda tepidariorum]|uniref:protein Gawky isoform X3 n=1 Tax=Parasteatoda tepidariorum TaxID=114398 RepID=UPI00077FE17E|nr:protein Gawky isoform X3 [Parasteatoda tepidariorum]